MLLMNEQSLTTPSGCYGLELLEPVTKTNKIKKFIHGHDAYPDLHIMFTCSHMDSYTNNTNQRT